MTEYNLNEMIKNFIIQNILTLAHNNREEVQISSNYFLIKAKGISLNHSFPCLEKRQHKSTIESPID